MAEGVLLHVATDIVTKLGSTALRELGIIWGVEDELQKLKDTFSVIQAVLLDAEEQQCKNHAVKNWISRLIDAFYDVDDLIDEFSYENVRRQVMTKDRVKTKQIRIFFSKSNQLAFDLQMAHKVKEIRKKLDAIAADRTNFNFYEHMRDTQDRELKERRYTHSFIREEGVIGRDDDREAIIDLLVDANVREDISVIAIVGIGGLGKTALAQSVYNNEKVNEHFELKLWVCVSEVFVVKTITEKIVESATNQRAEPLEMDSLQRQLRKQIDGKRYLLIMDDVWNDDYEKWVHLKRLLMGGAKGSKIVVTTRSQQVARTFDATIVYSLKGLSEYNSWLLFKQMAFREGEEAGNPNLIEIGKEIVAKLKGVPLAIRVIARLLYFKELEVDWLSFKENELKTIMLQENDLQSMLMLSYHHLPAYLKQCFTYCVLFPKDHEIPKDKVVKQWISQGLVQPYGMNKSIEDIGHDYFMELLWRSFFQDVRKNEWGDILDCKMHDLMHDLANSIVQNECVPPNEPEKRSRHASFYTDRNAVLELPESLFEVKKLRSLLLRNHPDRYPLDYPHPLVNKILDTFLLLRTLTLNIGLIRKLPKSIRKLKHLRYLDLSSNLLSSLPNCITELYNLETLILCDSWKLKELPKDTQNWIKLRHLDLHECRNLIRMPKGLGGLTDLQTLNVFVLGKDDSNGLSELKALNNLKGSLTLHGLKFCTIVDPSANYLKLKSGLRELELYYCPWKWSMDEPYFDASDDHERVLDCLLPHPNVEKLCIGDYQGVRLSNWVSSNSLVHLISLTLCSCKRLQYLPQFDQFPFLKVLNLESLTCIEYIDNNDSISSATFFPSLEKLSISGMPNVKGWWKRENSAELTQISVSVAVFPCLFELKIIDCCRLTSIPWHPLLRHLEINGVSMKLLDNIMKMTKTLATEPPPTLSELRYLRLGRIEDFEFLSKELFCNLKRLEVLRITSCSKLNLSSPCDEQHPIDEDDATALWKKLECLQVLYLSGIPRLKCLPEGLQHLKTLQELYIVDCQNLITLPESIGNLTSLRSLVLDGCAKLTSLPKGMCCLHALRSLGIFYCPELQERCIEGGEDWEKIAHIPLIYIKKT